VARRYLGRLVLARAEQPCGRRAAEQRNELAASKFNEFHSIPLQVGRFAGCRIGKDHSAGMRTYAPTQLHCGLRFNLLVTTRRA
jgi:hypothetical protein